MLEGRVAPPAVVVRQGEVWGAKVCGGDGDCAGQARFWVVVASHLVTRPTAQPIVEQSRAKRRSVCAVALAVQVTITASTSCSNKTK